MASRHDHLGRPHPIADADLASVAVIGRCAAVTCDRPARVHVEVEVGGTVVRGPVCERCEKATLLGAALLGATPAGLVARRPA